MQKIVRKSWISSPDSHMQRPEQLSLFYTKAAGSGLPEGIQGLYLGG